MKKNTFTLIKLEKSHDNQEFKTIKTNL